MAEETLLELAKRKIAKRIDFYFCVRPDKEATPEQCADKILNLLNKLGYHKPKGKPSLLSGTTVRQFWVEKSNPSENHWDLQGLLQAQREADIKFYEG